MRVALFDAILESHVTESLARAFRAAGHEVLSTGRLHHGHRFRTDDALARTLEPHLAAVRDFRPDWVIVFRPATAPWPVLRPSTNNSSSSSSVSAKTWSTVRIPRDRSTWFDREIARCEHPSCCSIWRYERCCTSSFITAR